MTVLVGILCSDGVVIGSDSAMAAGPVPGYYTIERQEGGALKIEVIENDVITAITGSVGLAQRFNEQVELTIKSLRQPFAPPQFVPGIGLLGSPIQQIIATQVQPAVPQGAVPYDRISPVEVGRILAQITINDFNRTKSGHQSVPQNGWGLGALLAFAKNDTPHLIEFDGVQFHPELKGLPDPERGDKDRIWRCVSMGAGQQLADSFLAHAYRLLFDDKVPTIDRAKLVTLWTINHVSRYNTGGVGGKPQLAILEKVDGKWVAHHEDPDQALQQMKELEDYISMFRRDPAKAAEQAVDLHEALDKPEQNTEVPAPQTPITQESEEATKH